MHVLSGRAWVLGLLLVGIGLGCGPASSLGYLQPPAGTDQRSGLGELGAKVSQALRDRYRGQLEHVPPPVSLVPTDGSELQLRALAANVSIEGPLAHTELHFTFHNTETRIREGRFSIALPANAAVARFAMKVNGAWREARVVSRMQGRRVYETFLKQRVDPALLEQDTGNQFSARVFPIGALADKEIIIAYEHVVSETQPYTLALRGLPAIPTLSVTTVNAGGQPTTASPGSAGSRSGAEGRREVTIERHDETPDDITLPTDGGSRALRGGEAFVARVAIGNAPEAAPLDHVYMLVDTSASRATVMGRQGEALRRTLAALPPETVVTVAAFDHSVHELYRGAARDAGSAVDKMFEHGALGASDLGGALIRAASAAATRVVIVGDGAPTLGEREPAKLAELAAAFTRVDAIQIGQLIDRVTLGAVVRAGAKPGAILDGRDPERAVRQLAIALPTEEPIRVDGAVATWPSTTRGVAPGEPVWVYGLLSAKAGASVTVHIGNREVALPLASGDATRTRRAVAVAELNELTDKLQHAKPDEQAALGERIERVALTHGLVSPRTSLIVLETDADEERFLGAKPDGTTSEEAAQEAKPDGALSFSGATSFDNKYIVEGINTGELMLVTDTAPTIDQSHPGGRQTVRHGAHWVPPAATPLEHDIVVNEITHNAFALGGPQTPPSEKIFADPYIGTFRDVMIELARNERERALDAATRWQVANPGDLAALIALGEALEARGSATLAARVYGSILDLYPNRAELLRAAGERLDRIARGIPSLRSLAIDAYRRAIHERPDQPSTYRLLAFALLRDGRGDDALDVLDKGTRQTTRQSIVQLLAEDSALIASVLAAKQPARRTELAARLRGKLPDRPCLRFVLSWETDANDVDLHVYDRSGNHAYYEHMELASGGRLYDDVTDGFGPEVFAVDDPRAFPYKATVHYYSRGAMGIGLGTVQVIRHDGKGNVTIDDRPFVIQNDDAMVDLGVIH